MYAGAVSGDLERVRYHIANNVNPNYQHPEIMATPLVGSIMAGHSHIALFLIDNGADLKLRSEFDNLTAKEAAVRYKNAIVLEKINSIENSVKKNWLQRLLRR